MSFYYKECLPFMIAVREKLRNFVSKAVIEFLIEDDTLEYQDILNKLKTLVMPKGLPKFSEDILLHHAHFICDQILSFDSSATKEDPLLIKSPFVHTLIDISGITIQNDKIVKKGNKHNNQQKKNEQQKSVIQRVKKEKKPAFTKATTTKLVGDLFQSIFTGQLSTTTENIPAERRRCSLHKPAYLQPHRSKYSSCKNIYKFNLQKRSKRTPVQGLLNVKIQKANAENVDNDSTHESDAEAAAEPSLIAHKKMIGFLKSNSFKIKWVGKPTGTDAKGSSYYGALKIENKIISLNDFIFIESVNLAIPLHVAQIKYMWNSKFGVKMIHVMWFWRASQTVLGEMATSNELYMVDDCQDIPAMYIKCKATVVYRNVMEDCKSKDEISSENSTEKSFDSRHLYYHKRYDPITARFEDILPNLMIDTNIKYRFCISCDCIRNRIFESARAEVFEIIEEIRGKEVRYGMFKFRGEEFRVGSGVYLKPNSFDFKYPIRQKSITKIDLKKVDEDVYPEFYRKYNDPIRESDTSKPFDIGYITKIYSPGKGTLLACTNLTIKVVKLYRPENTSKSEFLKEKSDLNLLYWSEEEYAIPLKKVFGKCYLIFLGNLDKNVKEWSAEGPNRFYFSQMYDTKNEDFNDPPAKACNVGKISEKSEKLKSGNKKCNEKKVNDIPPSNPKITTKLRTLDVFAGCGGLSEGLRQAGATENQWAIEINESAAQAYRLNHPTAKVFRGDCNKFLKKLLKGETLVNGQYLPRKGEVDLLCGGPPCQGFSSMNQFNSRADSHLKNSLITSYLSYCDYYRPRFFIMENVRNFVAFEKGVMLKLTIKCLLKMGYQCTFGIVQAGNYGVPQARRRVILLAAAPGEVLPHLPNPLHVFSKSACKLNVIVDGKKYFPTFTWTESAPYRTITVRDALSDLPSIKSGENTGVMNYTSKPISHFQRMVRTSVQDNMLTDHVSKEVSSLVEARIAHIPKVIGSDWRNLPNIILLLSNGTHTVKLKYKYHNKKFGKSSTGAFRGVCACVNREISCRLNKQKNTLIPWCLSHTANRNNNWIGLYGRLEWNGFFRTTITNPVPMCKQGRVLHPEQTRVVSVRECARSQGFSDSFQFYGNIKDKYRQVGNAVPPPLAAAIGLELIKSLNATEARENKKYNGS